MTEPTALPDLAQLAGCPPAQDRHRLDCLVRWLTTHGWPGAQSLGISQPITLTAGIGTLYLSPDRAEFTPTIKPAPRPPAPEPLPAPAALTAARLAVCATCPRFVANRCQIAGCGCAGLGNPSALLSRCPLSLWEHTTPSATQPDPAAKT